MSRKLAATSLLAIAAMSAQPLVANKALASESAAPNPSEQAAVAQAAAEEAAVEQAAAEKAAMKQAKVEAAMEQAAERAAEKAAVKEAAASAAGSAAPLPAAPVSELISAVDIPYEEFTLDNGLKVLVHTDRKAPVVGVSVWYRVGSKNEPKGKTGFAHLFEHLMFNGSENSPGDTFEPLQQMGATDYNGTTWFDRTNYFETVPTGALDAALMLESDRMGHLLGAVTQEKLDNQIGVVQNEKRQGDNSPYGMVEYEQLENLYPSGHPYHHSTIGSMDDLSSATLDDVKKWFKDNYGPNNAVLVLAGDIDVPTARAKVETWFGDIPAGPAIKPVSAPVPDKPVITSKTIYDEVPTLRVYRMWAVPGLDSPDYIPLTIGAKVLGGLSSSRLDNSLVRDQEIAVRVVGYQQNFAQGGQYIIYADAKPGISKDELAAALDAQIADFIANGPSEDELQRAATSYAASTVRSLESVGGFNGKAPTLAQGLLYNNDPAHYKKELEAAANATPEQVRAVTAKWLSRQPFELIVMPGTRKEGGENRGGYIIAPDSPAMQPAYYHNPALMAESISASVTAGDRSQIPPVSDTPPLDFPAIERATLSNGVPVYFARRDTIPTVTVRVVLDAGYSADDAAKPGIQSLMLNLMDEGTTKLDATQLAIEKERLGASLSGDSGRDNTNFTLDALKPNLGSSLRLMSDYIRSPGFGEAELERVRTQQLNRIEQELTTPVRIGQRELSRQLYGDKHPYGMPPSGLGTTEAVKSASRDDIIAFHENWITPEKARIYVVGDTSMAEIMPLLERSFGNWKKSGTSAKKDFSAQTPTPRQRIMLIDRPKSPQSVILAGRLLPYTNKDDLFPLESANVVYGGNFLSRINTNLRETKGWSYGVRSYVGSSDNSAHFLLYAPVQADRTGDSIQELMRELAAYTSNKGVNDEELTRLVNNGVRGLPGKFETTGSVMGGVTEIIETEKPDDYYEALPARYKALTKEELDRLARENLRSNDLVFVVVGDAKTVRPQLDKLGIPVETVAPKAE